MLTPLLAQIKKAGPERVRYSGNDLFFSVKTGRRGGFVASARGFTPDATFAAEKQGRLGISRTYAGVQVDGFAAQVSEDPKGAFISLAKKVTEDVMEEWQLEQNRILHGDGMAVRCLVATRSSSTVVTAVSPYGIASSGPGGLHLVVGSTYASQDASASFALLGKAVLSTVTHSGDTATLTFASSIEGSGTIAVGDAIVSCVPTGTSSTDTSFGVEPYGAMSIVDVEGNFATFEGINDAARWTAQTITSTSVDETIVMKLLNTIRARSGADWRTSISDMLLLTSTGIWQTYGESLLGLRRFAAPIMTLNGGFKATQVAGAALIDDPWCPRGRLYALYTPELIFVDLMDFGKLSFQDSPQWQRATNQDAYNAIYGSYWNVGCTLRSCHGAISGITDSVNFSPIFA